MRRLPVVGAVLAAVAVAMVVSTSGELPENALLSDPEVDVVIVPTPEQPPPPTPAPQPEPKPHPQGLAYVRPNGLAKVTEGAPAGVAIWRHPTDRRKSVVLGAAEDGGIAAYNLAGRRFLRLQGPGSP